LSGCVTVRGERFLFEPPRAEIAQIELMGSSSLQFGSESNGIQALGFAALLGFVYAFISRVLDLHFSYLHLPLVLGATTGICAIISGGLFKALSTRVGILYVGLTCWFAAGVPFAYWRGGSAGQVASWLRTLVIWAFLVGLTVTFRECKLLLNAILLAAVTAALMALIGSGAEIEGRLSLERGQLGNANYLALELLIALPLAWRFYSGGGRPGVLRRVLAAGLGGLILLALFETGSRAGLYSLGVMVLLVVLRVDLARKILIALAVGVLFVSMFAVLPGSLRERYSTVSSIGARGDRSAAASVLERQRVLRQSISITLTHPIFGVGLGNFAPYVFQVNKDLGQAKEAWFGTHNTYTQMSCEAGIPALLMFLGIIVATWRSLTRLIRATRHDDRSEARDIYYTAQAVQVCLGSFLFCLAFIHLAYDILPHMLLGVALAFVFTGERELRDLDAQQLPPESGNYRGDREILFSGGSLAPQVSGTVRRGAAAWSITADGRRTA
jgi:O-antigen ligase